MPAFLLVDTKIKNAEKYEEYKKQAKPIAEKYGGRYRARGGAMDVVQNELWNPTRLVLIEFPDMDCAKAFLADEDYQPIKKIREENSECTLILFEGV